MQIAKLDHVNLRTTQLDSMVEWYTKVLGMTAGDRPNFQFPGAWMYIGNTAVVHLVDIEDEWAVGSEVALKLEHFALSASGREAFEAKLKAMGEQYRRSDVLDINIIQMNVWDPDGNHIHVDFPADE